MLERSTREALTPTPHGDDGEGWLMSYLDVLTLLITLFVLLLSVAGNGMAPEGSEHAGTSQHPLSPAARAAAIAIGSGIKPRHEGLQPRFKGMEMEGVSVAQGDQGVTLRIDNNLLFSSGQATLTPRGEEVLLGLADTLAGFEGTISVEGHTDNLPISTRRFPSNWELSTGRAIAVLRYLAQSGVPEGRLRAIGYADTRPLESNATAEGRAENRRVELLLKQPADPV
ncbi:MAG: flagellar motor protein MotB [Halomonas sp.]